jgi:hypothetical protein
MRSDEFLFNVFKLLSRFAFINKIFKLLFVNLEYFNTCKFIWDGVLGIKVHL